MGKTSVYLSDELAEAVKNSPYSLAELVRKGLNVQPILTEDPTDRQDWITQWFCEVPSMDARYKVRSDGWHTDPETGTPVREIYKIGPCVASTDTGICTCGWRAPEDTTDIRQAITAHLSAT